MYMLLTPLLSPAPSSSFSSPADEVVAASFDGYKQQQP